MEGMTLR